MGNLNSIYGLVTIVTLSTEIIDGVDMFLYISLEFYL